MARSPLGVSGGRAGRGGRAGSWPVAWTGVVTSPAQPPGVQVPRAEPRRRRRGGPCGHALAASLRSGSGGSARAAAGAKRSRRPLRPTGPRGRRRPWLRAPGPTHAANLACELRPAAWQPQVRRLGAGSLSEPPPCCAPFFLRALSRPPSALRVRCSSQLCRLLPCGICVLSVLKPSSLPQTSHPDFPTFPVPARCVIFCSL